MHFSPTKIRKTEILEVGAQISTSWRAVDGPEKDLCEPLEDQSPAVDHTMFRCAKIRVMDLNPHLMCVLCGATSSTPRLSSSVSILVSVHRSDKTLQDLVYKLVPGLFEEEMRRRREFHKNLSEDKISHLSLEERGLAHMVSAHRLTDENISVVLELSNLLLRASDFSKRPASRRKAGDRRYLLCPVEVSIGHLKKFIRLKFSLPQHYQIDVFCSHSDEEPLSDDFTLLDISFIHTWSREKPLRLFYSVYVKPRAKRRKKKAQSSDSKKTRTASPTSNDVTVDVKTSVIPSSATPLTSLSTPATGDTVSSIKETEPSPTVKVVPEAVDTQDTRPVVKEEVAEKAETAVIISAPTVKETGKVRAAASRKSSTDSGSDSRASFSDNSKSARSRASSTDSKSGSISAASDSATTRSSSSSTSWASRSTTTTSTSTSPKLPGSRTTAPNRSYPCWGPNEPTAPSQEGQEAEISPDVTSPGAEDRANSGAMAEVPGEFERGEHASCSAGQPPAKGGGGGGGNQSKTFCAHTHSKDAAAKVQAKGSQTHRQSPGRTNGSARR
ncbi:hypothetical protein C0Q70_09768 [Pomacea canaliculata]|uniref:RAWUL domain-containing protein n=1 Tax=Pomacea canaliculata TaxID=400727 RepID=A0A2T7PAR5_POMCA|nr:hypothetical protein C0Q70_09768 [Pomacea canaliculata]